MFTTMQKWAIGIRLDPFFTRNRIFLGGFFSSDIFSVWLYFLWSYWQPSYYFRKKSPRNPKHRTLFPVTFFSRTWENSDFFLKFLFPGFFIRNFFPRTFLHRFKQYGTSGPNRFTTILFYSGSFTWQTASLTFILLFYRSFTSKLTLI